MHKIKMLVGRVLPAATPWGRQARAYAEMKAYFADSARVRADDALWAETVRQHDGSR